MKEAAKKHGALLAVLLVILSVSLLFAQRKNGMFIDEIYTCPTATTPPIWRTWPAAVWRTRC